MDSNLVDFISHQTYGNMFSILKYDKGISNHLRNGRCIWEENILNLICKYIKPGCTIIDIGANIGCHTVGIIDYCKKRKFDKSTFLISFEPQHLMHTMLSHNIRQSSPTITCKPYEFGLSNTEQVIYNIHPDYITESNPGGYGLTFHTSSTNNKHEEKVNIKKLDSFNLKNVCLIKIDVEGHENQVLEGALDTIKSSRPVMIVEILGGVKYKNASPDQRKYIDNTINFIKSLGYSCTNVSHHDYLFLPT